MTAESVFLLALIGAAGLVLVFASMAAGWAMRSRQYVHDMRALEKTTELARVRLGRVHELTDNLALERRVIEALRVHLDDDTVRAAVDSVTGASEGRHGR